ncbi:MAG: maleylpyruvate isomerase N-terminal domain-containing protein [Acidobacteriota bacterium]|nr:maleylpyruvate isomerase N-terminal domain-containing protein [Acidobacteriota bacterium]
MPLSPLEPTDTRALFRPVSSALVELLAALPPTDWERPTIAGTWVVRDVVAHLVDLTFRRLSFHRDRMAPPPPPIPIASERDFVRFINLINAQWIDASRRLSPRVLTDLFEKGSTDLADWFEALPPDAPGLFGVSWAGEQVSEGWFDVGREFTELWHHQQQIRMAVDAQPLPDPRYLRAVLEIVVRGLPHAYRDVAAAASATLVLDVSGEAGGQWTLVRNADRWTLHAGAPPLFTARVSLSDEALWKLLFNAVPERDAAGLMKVEGEHALAAPLVRARSVIV